MNSKERILEAIKQNPNATYRELVEASGFALTTVVYHVSRLIRDGVVAQGDRWRVL